MKQVFLRCFRDPIRVPTIENQVPRTSENYHRVPRIGENRVPRMREIGSLQVHTGYLTFSLKKTLDELFQMLQGSRYNCIDSNHKLKKSNFDDMIHKTAAFITGRSPGSRFKPGVRKLRVGYGPPSGFIFHDSALLATSCIAYSEGNIYRKLHCALNVLYGVFWTFVINCENKELNRGVCRNFSRGATSTLLILFRLLTM